MSHELKRLTELATLRLAHFVFMRDDWERRPWGETKNVFQGDWYPVTGRRWEIRSQGLDAIGFLKHAWGCDLSEVYKRAADEIRLLTELHAEEWGRELDEVHRRALQREEPNW